MSPQSATFAAILIDVRITSLYICIPLHVTHYNLLHYINIIFTPKKLFILSEHMMHVLKPLPNPTKYHSIGITFQDNLDLPQFAN